MPRRHFGLRSYRPRGRAAPAASQITERRSRDRCGQPWVLSARERSVLYAAVVAPRFPRQAPTVQKPDILHVRDRSPQPFAPSSGEALRYRGRRWAVACAYLAPASFQSFENRLPRFDPRPAEGMKPQILLRQIAPLAPPVTGPRQEPVCGASSESRTPSYRGMASTLGHSWPYGVVEMHGGPRPMAYFPRRRPQPWPRACPAADADRCREVLHLIASHSGTARPATPRHDLF